MKGTHFFAFSLLFFTNCVLFAQSKAGYWDQIRTTNQTLSLKAGEIKMVTSEDFPEGTTEIVYRITLLDKNQQISSSLTSILKSIPDPTGISQGAAGGVFLLSTISGEDKSKYAVFATQLDAENYTKTKKTDKACFYQEKPINKEAKVLSLQAHCFTASSKNVYFAFESDNWVLNQTIVLEIVPWVDVNLSRGWNASSKLELLTLCKSQKIYPLLTKKEAYSAQFIEKITQKYTRKEFSNLIAVEKNQYVATLSEQIVTKIGEIEVLHNQIRQNANNAFLKGDTEEAITLLKNELFAKNKAAAIDYYYLSRYYLMSKQFDKAEKICNEGLNLDSSEILLQLQLAHIYLFTERLDLAKVIHSKYKNQNINASTNWKTQTENDFLLFEKYNFPNHDFKKIIRIVD
jgi:hypothetical protein